jgi:hypothetical protein
MLLPALLPELLPEDAPELSPSDSPLLWPTVSLLPTDCDHDEFSDFERFHPLLCELLLPPPPRL